METQELSAYSERERMSPPVLNRCFRRNETVRIGYSYRSVKPKQSQEQGLTLRADGVVNEHLNPKSQIACRCSENTRVLQVVLVLSIPALRLSGPSSMCKLSRNCTPEFPLSVFSCYYYRPASCCGFLSPDSQQSVNPGYFECV